MGLSDDAPPQEVALAMAWARQEVDDCEVAGISSEDEPLFPTRLARGPRMTVGSGPFLRDVRDGCGRCSPGLWPPADRRFPTAPLWLDLSSFQWEAASNLTADGLLRDLALGSVVESPLAPRDVAFLERHLGGRLARGGHLRRQEAEDGIAVTLDWALFAALPSLACEPECVTLGSIAAGVRIGVAIRLPRARGIQERKDKLRGEVEPKELVFQDDYQSCAGSVGRRPTGCSDRARVGFDSEWVPERSVDGLWSRSTVWFSWSSLQGSARGHGVPDVEFTSRRHEGNGR